MPYVDVHTHLTHDKFQTDLPEVIHAAQAAGLGALVVNGLNPPSNREILTMAKRFPLVKPALGIYPLDAVADQAQHLTFPVEIFAIDAEIAFIASQAAAKTIVAIGECGLDGYWVGEETFAAQERVFEQLIQVALQYDLPLIIHTRKRERRAMEILKHHKVERVDFHCFGGKTKDAISWAEEFGWYFSIPANARRNEAFGKMLRSLPPERILTETDAPYLPPEPGLRNEPRFVTHTIAYLAELRQWSVDTARDQVWSNFTRLFKI